MLILQTVNNIRQNYHHNCVEDLFSFAWVLMISVSICFQYSTQLLLQTFAILNILHASVYHHLLHHQTSHDIQHTLRQNTNNKRKKPI